MPESYQTKSERVIPGMWYLKLVKAVDKMFPSNKRSLELTDAKLKKKYEEAVNNARIKENEFSNAELNYEEDSTLYRKAYKEMKKAQSRKKTMEKAYLKTEFKNAVAFIGMDIDYNQVTKLAIVMTMFLFIIAIAVFMPLIMVLAQTAPQLIQISVYSFLALIMVAVAVGYFLSIFPVYLAKRLRVWMLGTVPEAVNFMAMSMALTPSLDRAISFAAENLDDPLASAFRKVLWNVYTRTFSTIEESFLSFAYEWGAWNEELKRSFYTIRMSTLERTQEGVLRNLEKAKDIILLGTKRRIEDFASTLSTPTTILFALGVLLPMIIGSMLPMVSLIGSGMSLFGGGFTSGAPSNGTATLTSGTSSSTNSNVLPIMFVMDVMFPLIAFIYGYHILGKRPGTSQLAEIKSPYTKQQKLGYLVISVSLGVVISLVSILIYMGMLGSTAAIFASTPILAGIAAAISYYLWRVNAYQFEKRQEMLKIEEEFPDALFQIGSRMLEGLSLENALSRTSESMKGTRVGELFNKILFAIQMAGKPMDVALFGENGLLVNYPSKTIRVTMQTVVKLSEKEHMVAGKTIIEISAYFRDLQKVDSDIRHDLSGVVGMMKGTAAFFAPMILGITAALYVLLAHVIGAISQSGLIPVSTFIIILGVYLILMVMIIGYYVEGVEYGEVWVERSMYIAKTLPLSIGLFIISAVAGQLAIGSIG